MRHNRDKMVILFTGGYSYIQTGYDSLYYQRKPGNVSGLEGLLINGKPAPATARRAPGDPENYYQVKGKITSVARLQSPVKVVTQYKVRPEFADSIKAPISVAEYKRLAEGRREIIYEPEYREDPRPPLEYPIELHEEVAAPVKWPEGVMVRRPDYLGMFKSQWHTLPCFMTRPALMKLLAPKVKSAVERKAIFNLDYYENTRHMWLRAHFTIMGKDFSTDVFRFETDAKDGRNVANLLPVIEGSNLDELNAKVDAFIAEQLAKVEAIEVPKTCPCCEQKLPKGKKIIFPNARRW